MLTDLEVSAILDIKDFNKGLAHYRAELEKLTGKESGANLGPLPHPMSREGVIGLYWALWRYDVSRKRIR